MSESNNPDSSGHEQSRADADGPSASSMTQWQVRTTLIFATLIGLASLAILILFEAHRRDPEGAFFLWFAFGVAVFAVFCGAVIWSVLRE